MTTAKLCIAVVITAMAISSCHQPNPETDNQSSPNVTAESVQIDTTVILGKFSQSFSIPVDSLIITKHITGPETEKYLLLSEITENRTRISVLSDKIVKLGFEYEFRPDNPGGFNYSDTYTFAISSDLDRFSEWQKEINNLLARNDELIERLIEGDFSGSGAFYEAKTGKSTYWVFESPDGAVMKALRRK